MASRFYKQVTVEPVDGGFEIHLDGKATRRLDQQPLVVPTPELAQGIADEWRVQGDKVKPSTMVLTRLVKGALDRDDAEWACLVDEIVNYGSSDLLCYRAEGPAELSERQASSWQPLLDWADEQFGVALTFTSGIISVVQAEASLEALRAHVEALPRFRLAALHPAVPLCGSSILALALLHQRLNPEEAMSLCLLDELWQEEQWGQDDEAAVRRQKLGDELKRLFAFMRALDGLEAGGNPRNWQIDTRLI